MATDLELRQKLYREFSITIKKGRQMLLLLKNDGFLVTDMSGTDEMFL